MKNTEKLLSITNLKKYFPVAKTKWFQKEQLYVRANEDITIDIFSGETFGLVGESGCGKSTLGRTILQLYDQTAGSTLYYGRTLEDFAPEYVAKTLMRAPKMIERYKKEQAKAHSAAAEVEKAGEQATFYQHQTKNLLEAEAQTAFQNVVKILGGFAALDDPREGAEALLKKYRTNIQISKIREQMRDMDGEISLNEAIAKEIGPTRNSRILSPRFARPCTRRSFTGQEKGLCRKSLICSMPCLRMRKQTWRLSRPSIRTMLSSGSMKPCWTTALTSAG